MGKRAQTCDGRGVRGSIVLTLAAAACAPLAPSAPDGIAVLACSAEHLGSAADLGPTLIGELQRSSSLPVLPSPHCAAESQAVVRSFAQYALRTIAGDTPAPIACTPPW